MKRIYYLIILFVISVGILWFVFKKDTIFDNTNIQVDYFVENKSWETGIQKAVPYRKGDEISISFLFKNYDENGKKIIFDTNKLKEALGLDSLDITTSSQDLSGSSASIVQLQGVAGKSGITPQSLDELLQYQVVDSLSDQTEDGSQNSELRTQDLNVDDIEIYFDDTSYIVNNDNLIQVFGTGLEGIDSVGIGDGVYKLMSEGQGYYIFVPADSMSVGQQFVFVMKNNEDVVPQNCTVIGTQLDQEVSVFELFPTQVQNDYSRWITLRGKGLKNTVSIQLSNNSIFKKTEFNIVSDDVLAVRIPSGLSGGVYYINIMTLDGIYDFEDKTFEIQEVDL